MTILALIYIMTVLHSVQLMEIQEITKAFDTMTLKQEAHQE